MASHVLSQGLQKIAHLKGANVFIGMETDVKRHALSLWSNRNRGDRRNLRPVTSHTHQGCLTSGCPGFGDIGHQEKAAFVEERQGSPKPFSVFLYAATPAVSTVGWLSRFSPELFSPASGNSSPSLEASAKYDWHDKERGTSSESLAQCVSGSTDPWSTPKLKGLESELSPSVASERGSTRLDAPNSDANANLPSHCSEMLPPSAERSFGGRRFDELRPTDWSVFSADGEPAGDALPAAAGILVVSCI